MLERKNGINILSKMGLLRPKNSKDERFEDLKLFKKSEVGKSFGNGVRNLFF